MGTDGWGAAGGLQENAPEEGGMGPELGVMESSERGVRLTGPKEIMERDLVGKVRKCSWSA